MSIVSNIKKYKLEVGIIIIALVLDGFFRVHDPIWAQEYLGKYYTVIAAWTVRVLAFLSIGYLLSKRATSVSRVAKQGFKIGALYGVIIGVFEVIWYHNVNAFVFLVSLPWQTMLISWVLHAVVAYIMRSYIKEKAEYLQNK